MNGDERDGDDGSWADALGDVKPLGGRDDRVAERPAPNRRSTAEPARFHFPDPDDPSTGFADGIAAAQRRQLARGRIRPERRIDLHGLTEAEARRACLDELREAIDAGERCVIVVHGRGRRSAKGAVLRPALPGWLADPALEGRVLAFTPAQPDDGGSGASYVLLRRPRPD